MTPPTCNCWNCQNLLPAYRDLLVQHLASVDEYLERGDEVPEGLYDSLYDEAQLLLYGKVRIVSAAS